MARMEDRASACNIFLTKRKIDTDKLNQEVDKKVLIAYYLESMKIDPPEDFYSDNSIETKFSGMNLNCSKNPTACSRQLPEYHTKSDPDSNSKQRKTSNIDNISDNGTLILPRHYYELSDLCKVCLCESFNEALFLRFIKLVPCGQNPYSQLDLEYKHIEIIRQFVKTHKLKWFLKINLEVDKNALNKKSNDQFKNSRRADFHFEEDLSIEIHETLRTNCTYTILITRRPSPFSPTSPLLPKPLHYRRTSTNLSTASMGTILLTSMEFEFFFNKILPIYNDTVPELANTRVCLTNHDNREESLLCKICSANDYDEIQN